NPIRESVLALPAQPLQGGAEARPTVRLLLVHPARDFQLLRLGGGESGFQDPRQQRLGEQVNRLRGGRLGAGDQDAVGSRAEQVQARGAPAGSAVHDQDLRGKRGRVGEQPLDQYRSLSGGQERRGSGEELQPRNRGVEQEAGEGELGGLGQAFQTLGGPI